MTTIDLAPGDLETVRAILRRLVPEWEVRVFGSRVRGTLHRASDLDLVVMSDRPLDFAQLADLRDAFTESDLPFKVDIVDWAVTSDSFRRVIERGCLVIQPASPAAAPVETRR